MKETKSADRVCIVGAGPSGLIAARQLRDAGIPFDIFEKHSGLGGVWDPQNPGSPMYESAHFISSRYASGFLGFPMPPTYPDYPSWRQILAYIKQFAAEEKLDQLVQFESTVEAAVWSDDGWNVKVQGDEKRYRAIIAAPGPTWYPRMPEIAGQETFRGAIRHSSSYFSPGEFTGKRVLIVGAGNSGVDIACDAAVAADATFLSLRRGYRFFPKHVFGVPFDAYFGLGMKPPVGFEVPDDPNLLLDGLVGDLTGLGLRAPDHRAFETHPIINDQVVHYLRHGDITAKCDIARLDGDGVIFSDGSRETVDVVLLATGYEYRIPFIDESLVGMKDGRPQDLYLQIFSRAVDSLYVLGLSDFADSAFKMFEEQAQLIAMDLTLRGEEKREFQAMKKSHHPDLRGDHHYVDSPRHATYVDAGRYREALADVRAQFRVRSVVEQYAGAAEETQRQPLPADA